MARDTFDLGYYTLEKAEIRRYSNPITPYDISNHISSMSFSESMYSPLLYGQLQILDAGGIIDNIPLLGEEIFTLQYSDFYGTSITQEFFIYSISDAVPTPQTNMFYYTIKFVSPQHIVSSTRKIKKSYTGTCSESIKKIFDEYLVRPEFPNSINEIEIEDTTGIQTLVVPALQPIEAINFFCRRSFSADNKSSNFYFFQSREKFKMVTHEKLIEDKKSSAIGYSYDPALNAQELTDRSVGMVNIQSFVLKKRLNTIDEINRGSMIMDVREVDILNKQYISNIYKFKDQYNDYTHTDENIRFPHSDLFIENFFSDDNVMKSELVFKDFEREQQYYKDIIGPRFSNDYYIDSIEAEIEIFGRNDLFAGDVIIVNLPKLEEKVGIRSEFHDSLSGYWLVKEIHHNIADKKYMCKCVISKDLVKSGGVSTKISYNG